MVPSFAFVHAEAARGLVTCDLRFALFPCKLATTRHPTESAVQGADAIKFLERLVVGDVQALKDGTGSLSLVMNEAGGIIDDTVITKVSPTEIYMVLNAGCRDKDLVHFNAELAKFAGDCSMTVLDDRSLLALQGPKAVETLQPLVDVDLSKVYFSHFVQGLTIAGVEDCFLTRTGCALAACCKASRLPAC